MEIDVNEIKNGNYVVADGILTRVTGFKTDEDVPLVLCKNMYVWKPVYAVEPVELNKEILVSNGFRMSNDGTYGIFKSTFRPFGEHNLEEFEDYIAIDLVNRQSCLVKHQYLVMNTKTKGPVHKLFQKSFIGEITYAHQLQNIMSECGCKKELLITNDKW